MPDRCRYAAANGLPDAQIAVLESIVDAISTGSEPTDSLRSCERLVLQLQQLQPQKLLPLRPKNESRLDALANLQTWMANNSPESQAGVLWEFANNASSLCAKQRLESGSVFISIPRSLMVEAAPGVIQIDPFCAKIPSVALTLQLLIESRAPRSTLHSLYIASLPSVECNDLDSAWLWGFAEIQALLEGTSAFKKAIRTRLSTIQHYVYIMGRLKLPELLAGLTLTEWIWASAIVLSRQNQLPDGTPVLIPCWDMCNDKHSGAESYFIKGEDRMVAECKSVAEIGDEIFINYGQRSCAHLLALQGYLDEEHVTPVNVQATLSDLGATHDDIVKLRQMLFEKRSLAEQPMSIAPDGIISPGLQLAARVACLDRNDAAILLRNPAAQIISEANELRAQLSLRLFLFQLQTDAVRAQNRLNSLGPSRCSQRIQLAKSLAAIESNIFRTAVNKFQPDN